MDINQFKALLDRTPVDESLKSEALALFTADKKAEAISFMEKALDQGIAALEAENPEAMAEYKAAEAEYTEAVEAANNEFEATMTDLEAQAKQLEEDTSKQLEAVRTAELQESIQNS